MLGFSTPEEAAPHGGHVHEVVTVGNRRTGDIIRWEHCDTCPHTQPTTTWTGPDGTRHLLADGLHLSLPAGMSVEEWCAAHGWDTDDTDHTTTYVPADFDHPRDLGQPYGFDWAERDEWLHHLAGGAWNPHMNEDEYLDMLHPLDGDRGDLADEL